MSLFVGSCVAMVTPFTEDGVNYEALDKAIEFQISQGTDALLACGTTGEPSTMTQQEKRDVIRFTVEQAKGRLPVIAGVGGNNTEVVRLPRKRKNLAWMRCWPLIHITIKPMPAALLSITGQSPMRYPSP